MEKIIVLGTAGAVADGKRDNVSLLFQAQQAARPPFVVLIECGGSAAHKLAKLGIPYEKLTEIIVTHVHLDHVYGLPGFIFSSMYRDFYRATPLPFRIHCPEESTPLIASLLDLFALRQTPRTAIEIHGVANRENALILENEFVTITATPVDHMPVEEHIPTFGVKIFSKISGKSIVYSGDTGYSERLIRLATDADLLIHECSGLAGQPIPKIHSNARQVGEVAQKSRVKKLILLHIDTVLNDDPNAMIDQVREHFQGDVVIASDFDEYILTN